MRKAGVFQITKQFLVESLGLPDDTKIVAARLDGFSDTVSLCVEHEDLPECVEGACPKTVYPAFNCRDGSVPEFVCWGAK